MRNRLLGLGVLVVVIAVTAANFPPLWNGGLVAKNLERPTTIPAYIHQAAKYMDSQSHDTRCYSFRGRTSPTTAGGSPRTRCGPGS